MLQFIRYKITNKKLLNTSLLIGVALLAAFLCVYPMFREGSLDRLLRTLFTQYIDDYNEFPTAITKRATLIESDFQSVDDCMQKMDEYENTWARYIDVPKVKSQRVFHFKAGSADLTFGSKSKVVSLGYIPDLYEYADLVYGVKAEEADTSTSELVKSAIAGGAYPCVISQSLMDKYELVVGEVLSFKFKIYGDDENVEFVVTGVIEEKADDGYFWYNRLADYKDMLIVPADTYEYVILENEIYETNYDLSVLFDYTKIENKSAERYASALRQFRELDPEVTDNFLATLDYYPQQEKAISVILFTFELPIIALLLLFLYMISGRILEMETTEIAMLKSRGISRVKIIGVYVAQSSIIALGGCLLGLPAGYGLCRLAASTNAFLSFSAKDVSIYRVNYMMPLFALIAFALAVLFMTLPVIGLSKLTITQRRTRKLSVTVKPFWEKYFVDAVLLIVSGYLLYNYYRQRDALSLQILSGEGVDPVIFLDSSLFILSCGLLLLRLVGYLVRLVYHIGRKRWSPSSYVAFLQIIRSAKKQGFISVFLVMTIAMGVFNANLARTVNRNMQERVAYNEGCDMRVLEKWKMTVVRLETGETLWSYKEPDFEHYKFNDDMGVLKSTRVIIDNNTDITIGKKSEKGNTLMAINTKEFGETASLMDGTTKEHWFNYLNALALDPKGVIISSNLAKKYDLKEGDSIKYARYSPINPGSTYATVTSKICAITDSFPGFESTVYETNQEGEITSRDNYLIVANYASVTSAFQLTPYEVWMKLDKKADADAVIDTINSRGVEIKDYSVMNKSIQQQRDSAMLQITNGMFSIGFIVSLLICAVGFLIYWVLTIREREMIYGIYRAMGMSMREIVKILVVEQVFGSLLAVLSGFGVGAITTTLFAKLISIVYLPKKHNIPIKIYVEAGDIAKITLIFVAAFAICFAIMRRTVKNMNITKALKMGDD